ncbi:hypothetical protein Gotur_013319 [Gossypium turneri]
MTVGHTLLSESEKLLLREVFTSVLDSGSLSRYICTYDFFLDKKLIMERGFLDKVEDNAAVRIWSERTQLERGDSLSEGYVSELWDFTRVINSTYSCFTFEKVDLVPTVEEYMALLQCAKIQVDRVYSRANLKDIVLAHPNVKKRVDVLTLSIYDLVVFPKTLGHVDEAVTDLFDRLDKGVTPILTILAETFRSLSACRRAEIVATLRRDNISEEKWMAILQNLQEEDIEWRAPWLLLDEILYRYGDFDLVPLLGVETIF